MTLLSPTFMFLFLPLALAVYAPVSRFRKTDIIPVIGTVFFVCININSPIGLLYLLLVQAMIIVCTAIAKKSRSKTSFAVCRAVCFVGAVAIMVLRMFIDGRSMGCVGAIFSLMAAISLCNDVLYEKGRVPTNLWDGVVYVTYFPLMIAGPFIRYGDFVGRFDRLSFDISSFADGAILLMKGFVKSIAISSVMMMAYDEILTAAGNDLGIFIGVVLAAIYSVSIYVLFSGCSDIGRGISYMLGLRIERDMGDPFINPTPAHYLRNFFKGLTVFFKSCIAFPIKNALGDGMIARGISSFISAAFLLLLFSASFDAVIVLIIPIGVAMYRVLFYKENEEDKNGERGNRIEEWILKVFGCIFTFFLVSAAWAVIKVGDIESLGEYFSVMRGNKMFEISYEVKAVLNNSKYYIVPLIGALISVLVSVFVKNDCQNVSTFRMIIKGVLLCALSVAFVLCVVIFLPQFPELSVSEFGRCFM